MTSEKQTHIKVPPYHSTKQNSDPVYHIFRDCIDGNNIEDENRKNGRGKNRTLCNRCEQMKTDKTLEGARLESLGKFREIQKKYGLR